MIYTVTVTDKGQVTLPKALRDQLGIVAGTRIDFVVQPDRSLTGRLRTRGADGLYGLLAQPGERARTLQDMDEDVAAAVRARHRGVDLL